MSTKSTGRAALAEAKRANAAYAAGRLSHYCPAVAGHPFVKLLIGISVLMALTGCIQVFEDEVKEPAAGAPSTMAKGEPIMVGALLPLSGGGATYGLPTQRVLQIAESDVNAAGGVGGRPVKLVFEDGGCDATQANKAINNLVSLHKLKVIIGGICSSETLTAAPVVEAGKVVLLSPASSNPKISEAGDFVFRNYPSDNAQAEGLGEYAAANGFKKVGIIVEEQPYPEGIADVFSKVFAAKGGITVVEKFPKDGSDFRTQITKLQAAKVGAFFVDTQTPVAADLLVKQLQEAGVKGPLFLNDVAISSLKEVVQKYPAYLEGSIGAEVPYDKNGLEMKKLQERYKAQFGEELPYPTYMAPTYDSMHIVAEALAKVGEDGVKIKDYLYTIKGRKGLAGTLSFDSNGDPTSDFRHALRIVKSGAVEDYKASAMMKK